MITKLITFVSSLVAGASLLFGGAAVSSFPVSQSGDPGAGSQTQIAPHGDRAFQAAQVIKLDSTPRERFTSRLSMLDRRIGQRGLGLGDEIVRYGLVLATVSATGLSPVDVLTGIDSGSSILEANGHTEQEAVDYAAERIGNLIDRGVEAGKLTDTQAAGWLASIIADLEEMVKTPGLHIAGQQCSN
jgi:hypothetical protein